jgi:hypothetical protein
MILIRIHIGFATWIGISIEVKSWIWVSSKTISDSKLWLDSNELTYVGTCISSIISSQFAM